jgi:hypothetical protein
MAHQTSKVANQLKDAIDEWVSSRIQECFRCTDCGESVSPWEKLCPNCGRDEPARVALSAGVLLAVGTGIVLLFVLLGFWLF